MNQPILKQESAPEISPVDTGGNGLGATLKALRLAKHITLSDVSSRLKFSSRQLQALESEEWSRLPTGVSLRGLVKNYGRFLDADVDALLVMLDNQVGSTVPRPAIVQSSGAATQADLAIQAEPVSRPWGWFVVIFVLLVVAGFYAIERGWIPESWLIFDWLKALRQ
jgi:cytoskeletal protein RodZ